MIILDVPILPDNRLVIKPPKSPLYLEPHKVAFYRGGTLIYTRKNTLLATGYLRNKAATSFYNLDEDVVIALKTLGVLGDNEILAWKLSQERKALHESLDEIAYSSGSVKRNIERIQKSPIKTALTKKQRNLLLKLSKQLADLAK